MNKTTSMFTIMILVNTPWQMDAFSKSLSQNVCTSTQTPGHPKTWHACLTPWSGLLEFSHKRLYSHLYWETERHTCKGCLHHFDQASKRWSYIFFRDQVAFLWNFWRIFVLQNCADNWMFWSSACCVLQNSVCMIFDSAFLGIRLHCMSEKHACWASQR